MSPEEKRDFYSFDLSNEDPYDPALWDRFGEEIGFEDEEDETEAAEGGPVANSAETGEPLPEPIGGLSGPNSTAPEEADGTNAANPTLGTQLPPEDMPHTDISEEDLQNPDNI